MKWETEILSPSSYISNSSSSWMMEDSLKSTIWTPAENKLFENALAKFDNDTPDRWRRVAEMVPGKTVADVIRQYKELEDDVSSIEAGFYPKYRYDSGTAPFTLEWVNNHGFDLSKSPPYAAGGRRSPAGLIAGGGGGRPVEQERKKGVPWTEEEHKLFLLGLKKYGKGDWRNISRNFVVTRTPTQVASHAQKYFIRQLSGGKDKRRASIHDITTVNLTENHNPLPKNKRTSPEQCRIQWNPANGGGGGSGGGGSGGGAAMAFDQTNGSFFNSPRYKDNGGFRMGGGVGVGGGGGGGGGLCEFYGGSQIMVFPMQPAMAMHYPHG